MARHAPSLDASQLGDDAGAGFPSQTWNADRAAAACAKLDLIGAWRSLVARTVRVGEVPGSNPGAPIGWLAEAPQAWGFLLFIHWLQPRA